MTHPCRPLNRSEVAKLLAVTGTDTVEGRSIRLMLALSIGDARPSDPMLHRVGLRAPKSVDVPRGSKQSGGRDFA